MSETIRPRIGHGYDVHRLVPGRELVLGGVTIPFDRGLEGHSDADVLTHAVCDALLGAAALGDLGSHFPDTDEAWEGSDSLDLLARVAVLVSEQGYRPGNVDATVVLEEPRLSPHVDEMQENIAGVLGCRSSDVSVKATTSERMGFVGRKEGIAAHAVCLIHRRDRSPDHR